MTTVDNEPRRVFVTNYAGHDYTKAEKFGKLIFLSRGFVDFYSMERVKTHVDTELVQSSKEDYLLLSGSGFVASIICLLWFVLHGQVRILNFDKSADAYRETLITQENLDNILSTLNQ